jgi:hypothetical protein
MPCAKKTLSRTILGMRAIGSLALVYTVSDFGGNHQQWQTQRSLAFLKWIELWHKMICILRLKYTYIERLANLYITLQHNELYWTDFCVLKI